MTMTQSLPIRGRSVAAAPLSARRTVLATLAGLCLILALLPAPATAHPHIWVTVRTTVLYENGAITGFRHAWTFDEMYTAMAIDGLDANKDGKYSREELAELAQVNISALKEFGYFTFPRLGEQQLDVAQPKDFYLEYGPRAAGKAPLPSAAPTNVLPRSGADQIAAAAAAGNELTLHFTLPLAKPVLAEAQGFEYFVGDPSFFIAFDPAPNQPMRLGQGAPAGCRIAVGEEPKPAAPAGSSLAGSGPAASVGGPMSASPPPPDLSINFVAPSTWRIQCGKAG